MNFNVACLNRFLLCWLSIGVFFQLAGILFNYDGSRYATQLYLLLFIPALLLLLKDRFVLVGAHRWAIYSFVALAIWVILVGSLHPGSEKTPWHWLKVVMLVCLYLYAIARLVRQPQYFLWIMAASVVVAAIFAWLSLYYQFAVLERSLDYAVLRRYRIEAMGWGGLADLQHPIIAGLYYSVFLVLLTWFFVHVRVTPVRGVLFLLAASGLAVYVLFTFSRGAWFALVAGGGALLVLTANRKAYSLLFVGVMLGVVGAWLFWPEIQLERARGVTGRELIWGAWYERLSSFWLWGSGAGSDFKFRFPQGHFLEGKQFFHAHSFYLQFWHQYGLVGIVLFFVLLLSLLWKAWVFRGQAIARLGAALLVFAMIAMVSDIYAVFHRPSPYWVVFWLPVGILLGVQKRQQADFG